MKDDEKISDLLLLWEEAQERGEDLDAETLCADCPELIEPVRKRIAALQRMDWMTRPRSDTPDTKVGTTLAGRYRIDELVGEGGHGEVYRGFDPELQRPVAIKLPNDRRLNTSDLLEEARKVARLRHPGIVTVYDVGQHDEEPFIVSDFVSGTTLCEAGPFAPQQAAALIAEIAESLHAAHEQGFIHRDIKPANILIDQQGRPLLTDFGIATALEESQKQINGTLPYMSPEQLGEELTVGDPRTDIWSLGVVLYELLTGQLPFDDSSPAMLCEQIRNHVPLPLRGINSNIPPALEAIVLKCLAKAPEERYETALEVAAELRGVKKNRTSLWAIGAAIVVIGVIGWGASAIGPWKTAQPDVQHSLAPKKSPSTLRFIGGAAIFTPVRPEIPCTLEAWIRPEHISDERFVFGSAAKGDHGLGLAIADGRLAFDSANGLRTATTSIPVRTWSHVAVVFGKNQTRLFTNGKLVLSSEPVTKTNVTTLVVGRRGPAEVVDEYHGYIRSLRVSRGERYIEDFIPPDTFELDNPTALIYDGDNVESLAVFDISGNGNDGEWMPVSE
ncbi:protein kinase domain-containing protein [Gimesia chilikensis]|uniref:protein kinase domain-containing protein n=1 Tax=Gimesia chilikensis TaxID=2605989 RepID=UPI001658F861|nr:protein kinase [Gimesia chilikensis]